MRAHRILLTALLLVVAAASGVSAQAGFGHLYYQGEVVRTVVPPSAMPNAGMENLYVIMGGADGQLPVVQTAPGHPKYRGGKWAFHSVTWKTTPYLLTSMMAVLDAESAGDVSITRVPENDFRCPVQP